MTSAVYVAAAAAPARLLALVHAETAAAVRAALGNPPLTLHGEDGDDPAVLARAKPDLILVEVDAGSPRDRARLERLVALAGRARVIVTCAPPSMEGMRQMMRMGVADVLPQPIVAADLRALCASLARSAAPESATTVAVLKAGGGVGATTIATQMAVAGAIKGGPARVLLIDLDVQFGSAALHLDLRRKTDMIELLGSGERLDGNMLRAAAAHHADGIDLLPSPERLTPLDAIDAGAVERLLDIARGEYGLVVVELPQAWTLWTRTVLAHCDALVLVLELTVQSVSHASRQIDTLAEEGLAGLPLTLVANRVEEGWLASPRSLSRAEADRSLGRAIAATLPSHDLLYQAAMLGRPVGQLTGGKALAKRCAGLLGTVTQGRFGTPAKKATP